MKLLVGLGNPGEKYQNNRHNVGFMFADYLAHSGEKEFRHDKYLLSSVCALTDNLIIAKPHTYMNKSGDALNRLVQKYLSDKSLIPDSLIVAHDDLDIPLGKFRIVKGYGPKLHNGIESIENHLHFRDFLRIRIGVDNRPPENRMPGIDYVLHDFTGEEKPAITGQFPRILKLLESEYGLSV